MTSNESIFKVLTKSSINGTALVFISGWERAYYDLIDTNGLGVGFQQFGTSGRRGYGMQRIIEIYKAPLCELDGGSVAPKLIGEFGLLGVILIIFYLKFFIKFIFKLRIIDFSENITQEPKDVFFICCFIAYSLSLFVRGVGYFSMDSFLFIASICWFFYYQKGNERLI